MLMLRKVILVSGLAVLLAACIPVKMNQPPDTATSHAPASNTPAPEPSLTFTASPSVTLLLRFYP